MRLGKGNRVEGKGGGRNVIWCREGEEEREREREIGSG